MPICFEYAFCTVKGEITRNVFASQEDAEMWATRMSRDSPGTLYVNDGQCWLPDMVFGLADDDVSVVARGMAFLGAIGGADYAESMEQYLKCEDIPDSIKDALRKEIEG